ncbi:translation initiation factor IF-2-like [Perognathus longimembris pacificus]|uniref:translation initiation factor IF-2-like n=1 Tax=Perognathus longimembris pacificus TaxID=214514 RepID=UPI0020196F53|nr:translation initiation factor IF-2-like [Perognathus longimembris pacificus]
MRGARAGSRAGDRFQDPRGPTPAARAPRCGGESADQRHPPRGGSGRRPGRPRPPRAAVTRGWGPRASGGDSGAARPPSPPAADGAPAGARFGRRGREELQRNAVWELPPCLPEPEEDREGPRRRRRAHTAKPQVSPGSRAQVSAVTQALEQRALSRAGPQKWHPRPLFVSGDLEPGQEQTEQSAPSLCGQSTGHRPPAPPRRKPRAPWPGKETGGHLTEPGVPGTSAERSRVVLACL